MASKDGNSVSVVWGTSSVDGVTPVRWLIDPVTGRGLVDIAGNGNVTIGTSTITGGTNGQLLYDNAGVFGELALATYPSLIELSYVKGVTSAIQTQINAKGAGTVTAVSVASANGITGSSSGGATPALTITLGAITPTTVNGVTFTGSGSATLALGTKTLTVSNTLTLAGTDSTTMTFPSTSATIARTDAAQTFTGTQTASQVVNTPATVTVTSNAGTVAITSKQNNFTNSSASAMTITLTTSGAVDGQSCIVRIFDASAATKGITWVNTENSANVTAPTTSAGSTTIPLTVGFTFNSGTTKWTCVGFA